MNNNIKEVIESAVNFANSKAFPKGFYAGDGDFWVKCDDHQAAQNTKLKYIVFINGKDATIYNC